MKGGHLLSSVGLVASVGVVFCLGAAPVKDEDGLRRANETAFRRFSIVTAAGMAALDTKGREEVLSAISMSLYRDQEHLIDEFKAADNDEVRACLACIMGSFAMGGTARLLSEHITLDLGPQMEAGPLMTRHLGGQFPAVNALVAIGVPAREEMLRLLETSEDTKTRSLAVQVLGRLEGGSAPAVAIVEMRVKAMTDGEKKAKLEETIKMFQGPWDRPVGLPKRP